MSPLTLWLIAAAAMSCMHPPLAAEAALAERSRLIEVAPKVSIHVIDAGPPDSSAAIVLVPGWLATAQVWRRQIDALAPKRRVIAVDPRSQGESTKTAYGVTPEQRARDLNALIRALKLQRVLLVGWSQGVQDVAAYVQAFGVEALQGVVLVDATVSSGVASVVDAPDRAREELNLLGIYQRDPEAFIDGMMREIIRRPLSEAERIDLVEQGAKTPPAIGVAMLIADLFSVDRTHALDRMTRPTLVIASPTSPDLAALRTMTARLPKGRLVIVEEAGHAVFIDQPQRFNELLFELLRETD